MSATSDATKKFSLPDVPPYSTGLFKPHPLNSLARRVVLVALAAIAAGFGLICGYPLLLLPLVILSPLLFWNPFAKLPFDHLKTAVGGEEEHCQFDRDFARLKASEVQKGIIAGEIRDNYMFRLLSDEQLGGVEHF